MSQKFGAGDEIRTHDPNLGKAAEGTKAFEIIVI